MLSQLINKTKLVVLILSLCSFGLPNDSLQLILNNNDLNDAWWLSKNRKGIAESHFLIKINRNQIYNKLNYNFEFRLGNEAMSFSNSYIEILINSNNSIRIGEFYRLHSTYLNDDISSGSLLISNNAQALRKIGFNGKITSKNYKNLSFDYGISHGFLDKTELYIEAPYLHEKFIYSNLNLNNSLFSFGLVHTAMWAGHVQGFGKQPSTFEDYFRIFRASHGSDNALKTDQINALGNHLGVWDFVFQKNLINETNVKVYYQHLFEDDSGFRFKNKYDGLWGIEFSKRNLSFLLEYIDTTDQSVNGDFTKEADSYYNHGVYQHGWSFQGNSLGNPFISFEENIPVRILHFGLSKNTKILKCKILLSKNLNISNEVYYGFFFERKLRKINYGFSIANNLDNNEYLQFSLRYQL